VLTAVSRGIALFLGAFSLLNLAGDLRFARANANLWWIDFWPLPDVLRVVLLAALGVALLAYGFVPKRRTITTVLLVIAIAAALANAVRYYAALARGDITTTLPIPLSLFVAAALVMILWSGGLLARREETGGLRPRRSTMYVAIAFIAASILFPIAQTVFFGVTDYRRPADVIVVFGARAYADGTLSSSLADRVNTGVELYRAGLAPRIVFSGGPGDGAIHETEAMRRAAMERGVPASAIALDPHGVNTEATVRNTARRGERILAVSHFYHLPRIKMTYQRYGVDAWTVPARASAVTPVAYNVARESVAFWAYYLRRLR
jgi:vancomycin permeability regulator SanA